MSAVIVKGIIISLSLAAAVGIALQSPEVKEWLEEQRRKLAELLRNVSEGLDPQTRREAEAFAYEGRIPTAYEREGMENAAAVATGRETEDAITSRRLHRQSTSNPIDAEERRRLGREYLAKRNQELLDMKKKRESEKGEVSEPEPMDTGIIMSEQEPLSIREKSNSVGSFDHLINDDGSLRLDGKRLPLSSEADSGPLINDTSAEQVQVPVAVRGLNAGAMFANPFADEFAMSDPDMDRSATPRPPVPPKIALGSQTPTALTGQAVESVEDPPEEAPEPRLTDSTRDLSYDEQLARALSISLAESEAATQTTIRRTMTEQEAFEQAIQESLKEAERAERSGTLPDQDSAASPKGPLVDFSSDVTPSKPSTNPFRQRTEDDDLYYLTPAPTGARASNSQDGSPSNDLPPLPDIAKFLSSLQASSQEPPKYEFPDVPTGALKSPFDSPKAVAASEDVRSQPQAAAIQPESVASATLSPSPPPNDALSTGYHTESDTDDFASLPDTTAQSEGSLVEVEDVDIESMSDDDDGIHTPRSWSEVGSDVGDSERSESEAGDLVHV